MARRICIASRSVGRIGSRRRTRPTCSETEWDAVLMVLFDEHFDAVEIHQSERSTVLASLKADRVSTDPALQAELRQETERAAQRMRPKLAQLSPIG